MTRLRAVLFLMGGFAIAACTFPEVTYRDGGGGDGECTVTDARCLDDATRCRDSATQKRNACLNPCMPNDEACEGACQAEFEADLPLCASDCEGCVWERQQCDGEQSCRDLVGL